MLLAIEISASLGPSLVNQLQGDIGAHGDFTTYPGIIKYTHLLVEIAIDSNHYQIHRQTRFYQNIYADNEFFLFILVNHL